MTPERLRDKYNGLPIEMWRCSSCEEVFTSFSSAEHCCNPVEISPGPALVFHGDSTETAWIETYTGRRFDLLDPEPDQVSIIDIAHSLAAIVRFGGHARQRISVAEHSLFVSRIVAPEIAIHGLLHDAAEAYIGDITRPMKALLHDGAELEERILQVIYEKYGLDRTGIHAWGPRIKAADNIALKLEAQAYMHSGGSTWSPWFQSIEVPPGLTLPAPVGLHVAKSRFLTRFAELEPTSWDCEPRPLEGDTDR